MKTGVDTVFKCSLSDLVSLFGLDVRYCRQELILDNYLTVYINSTFYIKMPVFNHCLLCVAILKCWKYSFYLSQSVAAVALKCCPLLCTDYCKDVLFWFKFFLWGLFTSLNYFVMLCPLDPFTSFLVLQVSSNCVWIFRKEMKE